MSELSPAAIERARVEFGSFLSAQRVSKGLSRAQLSQQTRVPLLVIGALEEGDGEKWPEPIFTANALRRYADAVGLPGDETVRRFEGLAGAPVLERFDPVALEAARRERAVTGLLAVLAGAVAAGAAGAFFHVWRVAQAFAQ